MNYSVEKGHLYIVQDTHHPSDRLTDRANMYMSDAITLSGVWTWLKCHYIVMQIVSLV